MPLNEFYAPGVRLTATIVQEGQIRSQSIVLPVGNPSNQLKVQIQSDQTDYRPGQTASYNITTRDADAVREWQKRNGRTLFA